MSRVAATVGSIQEEKSGVSLANNLLDPSETKQSTAQCIGYGKMLILTNEPLNDVYLHRSGPGQVLKPIPFVCSGE